MIKIKFVNPKFLYCLQFVPACNDALKPVVGMKFDSIAHHSCVHHDLWSDKEA
jgi:hypothetical protein